MSNALTPEQQRAMVAAYTIPLPEPAFGFLVVSEETGQWIGSRAGEAAFDADNLRTHAAAVSAAKDAEIAGLLADYERACKLVADMHAAAMGANVGPVLGVVEDVAALRGRIKVLEDALWDAVIVIAARAALGDSAPTTPPPSTSPQS